MSLLSPRLQLNVSQKQILTPGLVQMVTLLQLNRLELREMIDQELAENPVLEETADVDFEELTAEELLPILEAERVSDPADQNVLDASGLHPQTEVDEILAIREAAEPRETAEAAEVAEPEASTTDTFDEIDFGEFFDDYLDPGYRSPDSEKVDKPSFETFLSSPVTLTDHLESQLSMLVLDEPVREAANVIVGNIDENGYLCSTLEEVAEVANCSLEQAQAALETVQGLDPTGIAARDLRECLLLQLENRHGVVAAVAWEILSDHMKALELHQMKELARKVNRSAEMVNMAVHLIQSLDPRPGTRYSGRGARLIEPDVYIFKDGDDYIIQLNDEDLPPLRLNAQYRHMLDRNGSPDKEVRNYVRERYTSALQLMKNIEQRRQTIMKVCKAVVERQREFLDQGLDYLKPMMIKDVAEEVGVHPSTVSRAVANKYAHTPQGVFELRYFFSEPVQGPLGLATPLLLLKRKVKKMIAEEDPRRPLTDEQIMQQLQGEGIQVTRRTVAKYREDMKIPSTHQRRQRE